MENDSDEEERPREENIRVVVKEPNKQAEARVIPNDYKTIASLCGGCIDITEMPTDETVDIICNDECLINGMEPCIVMPEREGVLCGTLVFAGYDPETGNSTSLSEEQQKKALRYCERNKVISMSLEGAYRYSKVIGPLQQSYDELGIDETKPDMEVN